MVTSMLLSRFYPLKIDLLRKYTHKPQKYRTVQSYSTSKYIYQVQHPHQVDIFLLCEEQQNAATTQQKTPSSSFPLHSPSHEPTNLYCQLPLWCKIEQVIQVH